MKSMAFSLPALLIFSLSSCKFGPTPPTSPPVDPFPVVDVQNPTENFLGLDNITIKSKIDPTILQPDMEVRQYWEGAPLAEFADTTKVNADGTFTLTITATKINSDEYGFQPYYGSPDVVPAHILLYDSNVPGIPLLHGDVQRKQDTSKYNRVVYAPADFTYVKVVNTYPAFPNGYTYSLKLKKGFNMIYVQEERGKGLLTTSYKYEAPYFTDFLKQ